ncbi:MULTISPECIES: phosphate signaling complex protein PhoU [Clostridium]|uniref:Phosphate-specific transport system accessory protein PhoU n=1 Tax=Clostridium aquiflavi TaxID=3073603 RepID=A0ABU1EEZ3_9CLOT|nr:MULTISPECIES: phosphate signaling complex protein PhoU [unclassified Clostridium]MDR5586858.1 phosphate signaling complex protein PhoU [Clostridium sp. 5N-1]NFG61641.1 phosphate signaling complex protein PhoU [Clostridium botulinum]NFQ10065.1 phosphate signaling complex protein PhoU [Clostridium botulinum]
MTRESQDARVKEINRQLLKMTSLVEKQIHDSMVSLKNHDSDMADKVIKYDDKVDELQKIIEEDCIKFIAMEQPLATDLRRVFTASKIVTDLERMADHAVDICKITKRLDRVVFKENISELWDMEIRVREMIGLAIDSYIRDDVKFAYKICKMDDAIDDLYKRLFGVCINEIKKNENLINQGTQLLFVIKYLERIADHVTNICEWTIFSKNGTYVDLNE